MLLSKVELGKRVKEARKRKSEKIRKKYTQVMLAHDLDMSQGYIGDIESGRTYPSLEVLSKITEACEVDFNFFTSTDYASGTERNSDVIKQHQDEKQESQNIAASSKKPTDMQILLADNSTEYIKIDHTIIIDVKTAMEVILSQPGLSMNGKVLSDESKIALANAIQMGLQLAELMEEKKNNK